MTTPFHPFISFTPSTATPYTDTMSQIGFPRKQTLRGSLVCKMFIKKCPWQDRNKDADIENGLEDTGRGKGKLGQNERVAWTYIHYQM